MLQIVMKRLILIRTMYEETQTRGILLVVDNNRVLFDCNTLELPWRDNHRKVSCVPAGTYRVVYEYSPKFKQKLYELKKVPNRSEVKIHVGNFASGMDNQIAGCILVGSKYLDINHDGIDDIVNSRQTLNMIHYYMADIKHTTITIYGKH